MHHPTYEQVDRVASVFEALAEEHNASVRMTEADIIRNHPSDDTPVCGTIACHAGWYAYHTKRQHIRWKRWKQYSDVTRLYTAVAPQATDDTEEIHDLPVTFILGCQYMAQDLGFTGPNPVLDMLRYYMSNTEIWGNPFGYEMFDSKWAFSDLDDPPPDLDLSHLAKHWRMVAERTKNHAESHSPK